MEEINEDLEEEIEEMLEDEESNESEEDEEISEEEFRNSRLNKILSNPWKTVALEEREFPPSISLESNFEGQNFHEEENKQTNNDYFRKSGEEDGHQYQKVGTQGDFDNSLMSQEEKALEEQKRLYFNPQRLRPENRQTTEQNKGIVTPESTMKKNYLTGRKF